MDKEKGPQSLHQPTKAKEEKVVLLMSQSLTVQLTADCASHALSVAFIMSLLTKRTYFYYSNAVYSDTIDLFCGSGGFLVGLIDIIIGGPPCQIFSGYRAPIS